jgi:NADH:ubiquinone oxidoreductase subunit F (NADH-binding)/NADH:ubiquinone oxidoreductase subunit E
MIVQELSELQKRNGYLPARELAALGERLGVPLHRLHEVASFFPHYRLEPPTGLEVKVCRDMACYLRGAPELRRGLEAFANELGGDQLVIEGTSCLGQCDRAPAVVIGHHVHHGKSPAEYRSLVRAALVDGEGPAPEPADRTPLPWKIDPYSGREEYAAARKFAAAPDANGLIENLKAAELRGMGGAGAYAFSKWNDVWQARGTDKYIVCNADESEPATFKDREILLRSPHLVLEGMILAGLLTRAKKGIVYIRHEYDDPISAVRDAIARAEKLGACGANVFGTGRSFPIEVFISPGGYVCGEQSALIEVIEDRRSEPRNKPPELLTNGLFDQPTLVSNVETFAWVPAIQCHGGSWYATQGVSGCKGLRFFSVCGEVSRPGVYEVPIGLTLRELIYDRAGGIPNGRTLKAVATSGPSGGFLPRHVPSGDGSKQIDILDIALDLKRFGEHGLMLGAGLVVYGQGTNLLDQALNASEFFRNESCGKCVPCRLGSQRMVEIAADLRTRKASEADFAQADGLVTELQRTMRDSSICGLGQVAGNPLASVLRSFRDDFLGRTDVETQQLAARKDASV